MSTRTRKTQAGYTVSWRYKGHRYSATAPTKDRAAAMTQAIKAKRPPSEVVSIGYMLAKASGLLAPSPQHRRGYAGGLARSKALNASERSAIARAGGLAKAARYREAKAEAES